MTMEEMQARIEELEREVGRRKAARAKAVKAVHALFSRRTAKTAIYLAVLGAAGAFLVAATITAPPNSFTAGTAITASAVNGNFSALWANDQAMNAYLFWGAATGGINYAGGNVGIGTTNPLKALDVAGDILCKGLRVSDSYSSIGILLEKANEASNQRLTEFSSWGGGLFAGRFINDAGTQADDWLNVNRNAGTYTVKNVCFPAGNVGIGTTDPGTYSLAISKFASGSARDMFLVQNTDTSISSFSSVDIKTGHGDTLALCQCDSSYVASPGYSGFGTIENASTSGGVALTASGSSGTLRFLTAGSSMASNTRMVINSSGNVGIGTTSPSYRLQVGDTSNWGYVSAVGQWTQGSDISSKQDIAAIDNALDKVLALYGISYTARADNTNARQIGFIAQDMEKVVPEIVSTDPISGLKGIAYPSLTPVLVEAIKELKAQNDTEIQVLRDENAVLTARLDAIEKQLAQ